MLHLINFDVKVENIVSMWNCLNLIRVCWIEVWTLLPLNEMSENGTEIESVKKSRMCPNNTYISEDDMPMADQHSAPKHCLINKIQPTKNREREYVFALMLMALGKTRVNYNRQVFFCVLFFYNAINWVSLFRNSFISFSGVDSMPFFVHLQFKFKTFLFELDEI